MDKTSDFWQLVGVLKVVFVFKRSMHDSFYLDGVSGAPFWFLSFWKLWNGFVDAVGLLGGCLRHRGKSVQENMHMRIGFAVDANLQTLESLQNLDRLESLESLEKLESLKGLEVLESLKIMEK